MNGFVKIIDFDISLSLSDTKLETNNQLTFNYASPNRLLKSLGYASNSIGDKITCFKDDAYSLGIVLL